MAAYDSAAEIIAKTKNIVVIGRTGDGKSAFCKRFSSHLGFTGDMPFVDSQSASSHTHDPEALSFDGWQIIDTPGLMDTNGFKKDEENLVKIVNILRSIETVNLFVLTVNFANARFDSGMQDALKLFVDSFGENFLKNLVIVFTHVSTYEYKYCRLIIIVIIIGTISTI